ncbi:MAG: class I SAM-dependent methyltransferase [Candidatus Scalindua sediminis]|nr:class I SAM-dependent methyltransferase [Candidatus Scalindua sediminis]
MRYCKIFNLLQVHYGIEVFNDYNFLAKHVRKDNSLSLHQHQQLAFDIVNSLPISSVLDIGSGSISYVSFLGKAFNTNIVDLCQASLENVSANKKITGALPTLEIEDKFDFVSALEALEHLNETIYEDSLREIAKLSKKYIFITSPFLQDLSSAYVLCDKCQTIYQCEGHCRSFDFKAIEALQEYFGGVAEFFFIGKPCGNYFIYAKKTLLKSIIRRTLQKTLQKKYCHPPFTKCPGCGSEMFNNYEEYLNRKSPLEKVSYWKWREARVVTDRFGALFDKQMSKTRLY